MNFHKYLDSWQWAKRLGFESAFGDREAFFNFQIETSEIANDPFVYRQTMLEQEWIAADRPYYNVWPVIIPALLKLKLDMPCASVKRIAHPLELRLPESVVDDLSFVDLVTGERHSVRTLLIGVQDVPKAEGADELVPGLVLLLDVGERDIKTQFPIYTCKFFPLRDDMTVDIAAESLPYHSSWEKGLRVPQSIVQAALRLAACITLLEEDSDLLIPDILNSDKCRWESATQLQKEKMIERARKANKNGFDLGSAMEIIPHFRRPHPAVVWTGKGRLVPRITLRRGSVVHRSKLSSIPTGHDDAECI